MNRNFLIFSQKFSLAGNPTLNLVEQAVQYNANNISCTVQYKQYKAKHQMRFI